MDIRVYDGADGRYLHAEDLTALLRKGETVADPVTAVVLPRIIRLVDELSGLDSIARPTPATRDADPNPHRHGWV